MSRDIPQDQPLSDEDRAYLEVRGQYGIIKRIDELNGGAPDADPETETEESLAAQIGELEAQANDLRGRQTALRIAREQHEAGVRDNTVVDGKGGTEDRSDDYEDVSWTKARLAQEIDKYNADRDADEKISTSGTKAQLVERLRALDAEAEDDEDDEDDE
jgi:hypothetical protein